MTLRNDRTAASNESTVRTSEDVLEELLEALRSDQGGARTSALRRALAPNQRSTNDDRIERLESSVASLVNDAEGSDGAGTTDAALEDRIDELEDSIDYLRKRLSTVAASTRTVESDLAETRESLDAASGVDSSAMSGDEDDLRRQFEHLESKLDSRTSALASEIESTDDLGRRIDDVESDLERRIDDLSEEVDELNETLEKAVRIVQEQTRDEIAAVRSSIESLEDDVDTLEWHAIDTNQWRESVEATLDLDGNG